MRTQKKSNKFSEGEVCGLQRSSKRILGRLGENKSFNLRKRYRLHSKIAPLNVGRANNKLVLTTV